MTAKTQSLAAGSSGNFHLFRQYIYGPLQAVSVAANVVWTLWVEGKEASSTMNCFPASGLWVATPSGTLRGTIRATATGSGLEYGTASESSQAAHATPYTNSGFSIVDGDYLVLEIGMRKNSTVANSASMYFGDDQASDHTTNGQTGKNPAFIIATDLLIYNPDISVAMSLGSLTLTGLAAIGIRESAGASVSLATETLTGLAMTGASAQAKATISLATETLTGVAAVARVDAGATLDIGTETLTGVALTAAASITALLDNTTELVITGEDFTAQVLDESGDYSVLVNRGTITNTGLSIAVSAQSSAAIAEAILTLAGQSAIMRQDAGSTVNLATQTLTGLAMSATEQEVGTMTRGVLTITGVEMLVAASVLSAMGHGTLTFTGTTAQGRLGFRFSQFSII